ncbi:MAG: phosphoethanolamine transferase [Gammaproteobacteria bacterium]|nr:MAG: phosphoethanolamine transferase [Gammaproteobacteria bacterium]TND02899.1 MAG: phosphoethanolamine transferase [Gammaproteobacteria bacterium]
MKRISVTQHGLILVTAVFLVATANTTFFAKVIETYALTVTNIGFLLSVPLLLACILVLVTSLVASRYTTRPVLILMVLVAAPAAYFTDRFGTVIDDVMIQNMVDTNTAEATDLLTIELALRVLLLGIVPAILIWRIPVRYRGVWPELRSKALVSGVSVLLIAAMVFAFSGHYASFFREHKPLRYHTNPTYPLYSLGRYWVDHGAIRAVPAFARIGEDAAIPHGDPEYELVIMVVGETARADRFSLNGYSRDTNPLLSREPNLHSYTNVMACGTSTAVSVPCMFALAGREDFDRQQAEHTENVLDVLQRAGVSVLWRDNNSDSKGVASRVAYQDFQSPAVNPVCDTECRDEGMLAGLQDFIDRQHSDILIVLHQMGNHGPAYYKRYPAEFEHFKPACQSAELSQCSLEEINNAYDNAIRYTDRFLAQVVALLKANTAAFETAMLYVSDHGESLGEHGLYLHGLPYAMAPREQKHVPVLLWLGDSSDVEIASVIENTDQPTSQDAIFHSLLAIFEVNSSVLDRKLVKFKVKEAGTD